MVVDGAKNVSDIKSQSFQMKDGTPPTVKSLTVTPLQGGTRAEFTFTASEPGDYYYYVRKRQPLLIQQQQILLLNQQVRAKQLQGNLELLKF